MLIMSLDEGGRFELNGSSRSGCMFIAGTVYLCDSESERQAEAKRIFDFFRTICDEQSARFPYDLHFNWNNGRVVNGETASKVKQALAAEMPDFMRGSGRWKDRGPKGTYGLYAMAGDRWGMRDQDETASSNMLNDEIATNRYEHMVYRTIENLLFYNHRTAKQKEVELDLATRIVDVSNGSAALLRGVEELGHARRRNADGTFDDAHYIVTDESSFRVAIDAAVERAAAQDMRFCIKVRTINYDHAYQDQAFLYMADTVCSMFQEEIGGCGSVSQAVEKLMSCCERTVGKQMTMLWAYHPVDRAMRKAVACFRHADLFNALLSICEIRAQGDRLSDIYDTLWLTPLEKFISHVQDPLELKIAAERLDEYLRRNGSRLNFALDIYKVLTAAVNDLPMTRRQGEMLFRLSVTEMTIRNHMGDFDGAMAAYRKCSSLSHYASVEEFLGIQNMLAVSLLDKADTQEALRTARSTVSYHEMLIQIKKEIYSDHREIYVSYGRALSMLGQCLAFSGRYDEAIDEFKKALDNFKESEKDSKRTISYLLQAAIEADAKDEFEHWSTQYYGTPDMIELWKKRKEIPDLAINDKYALYVYVKALYVLYRDRLSGKDISQIVDRIMKLYDALQDKHPWEMILKYCALLSLWGSRNGDISRAEKIIQEVNNAVNDPTKGVLPQILKECHDQFEAARNGKFDLINNGLTYMYR